MRQTGKKTVCPKCGSTLLLTVYFKGTEKYTVQENGKLKLLEQLAHSVEPELQCSKGCDLSDVEWNFDRGEEEFWWEEGG